MLEIDDHGLTLTTFAQRIECVQQFYREMVKGKQDFTVHEPLPRSAPTVADVSSDGHFGSLRCVKAV